MGRQILLLISLILLGVSSQSQNYQVDCTEFFKTENFVGDTLFIKTRFMECGEWGGHLELTKVYLKDDEFYATYHKYSADCNSIRSNNGQPVQTLVKIISKKLLDRDKIQICRYFHQLVDAKIREPAPMHAGYIFEISKTDKSINLFVYSWGVATINEYKEFIAILSQ